MLIVECEKRKRRFLSENMFGYLNKGYSNININIGGET